jgi:predicted O-methyltransferase YrrM
VCSSDLGTIPIISFDEFKKLKKDKVIITDINLQYVYLDLLYYEILLPSGLINVEGLWKYRIRYNYDLKNMAYGNNPEIFDYDYLTIKKSLPMDCTIPYESIIRLIDCVKVSAEIDGDILEVGTGEGGSTFFMASIIESYGLNKKIISVDGFEPQDYLPNLSYETVSKKLERFPFVTLVKGYAPQILYSEQRAHVDKIAFAFVDLYAFPDILQYIYARVAAGGIILIDNYNHGCYHNHGKPIADVFFLDKKEKIIRVGGTQGLVVKQ